jgi:GNAT superfamily N-acetyltransferase
MNLTIHAIEPQDSELILPLLEIVQSVHSTARPDIFRRETDRSELSRLLQDWLATPATTGLVGLDADARALGYLVFEIIQEHERHPLRQPSRFGFLHHICVDPGYRRVGIASRLVEEMKERLRLLGIARLATEYWAFNAPSAAFMAKAGFVSLRIVAETKI